MKVMEKFRKRTKKKSAPALPVLITAFLLAMAVLPLIQPGQASADDGNKPDFAIDAGQVKPTIQIKLTPGTVLVDVSPTPTPRVVLVDDDQPDIDINIDVNTDVDVQETPQIEINVEDMLTPPAEHEGDGTIYINKHGCPAGYIAAEKSFNDLAADCQDASNGIQFGYSDGGGYLDIQNTGDVVASGVQFDRVAEGAYSIVEQVPSGFAAPRAFCNSTMPGEGGQGANFSEESVLDGNQIFHVLQSGESFYCDWFNFQSPGSADGQPPISLPDGTIFDETGNDPIIKLPGCVENEDDAVVLLPADYDFDISSAVLTWDFDVQTRGKAYVSERRTETDLVINSLQLSRGIDIFDGREGPELHIPLCNDFEDADVGGTISISKTECPLGFDAASADVYDLALNCNDPVANVQFILSDGAQAFDQNATDASGTAAFSGVPAGAVSIVEQVPAGYGGPIVYCVTNDPASQQPGDTIGQPVLDGNQVLMLMPEGGEISCTWYNVPVDTSDAGNGTGVISIFKGECPSGYDAAAANVYDLALECGTPLEGVNFLLSDGASAIAQSVSDASGSVGFDDVPPIPVSIVEQVPAGYGAPRVFCISNVPGDNAVGDTIEQQVLDGNQIFHLMAEGESLSCTWYNVSSLTNDAGDGDGTISIFKGECPLGFDAYTADVYDLALNCNQPQEGVTFLLSDGASAIAASTTDDTGLAGFNGVDTIPVSIVEQVPAGYGAPRVICISNVPGDNAVGDTIEQQVLDGNQIFHLMAEGESLSCTWYNVPSEDDGVVVVHKWTCANNPGISDAMDTFLENEGCTPTDGIEFTLSYGIDTIITHTTSANEGATYWDNLPATEIHLTESIPAGYGVPVVYCSGYVPGTPAPLGYNAPEVIAGSISIPLESNEHLDCWWINIPADDGEIIVIKYTCEPGYDLYGYGADPKQDCKHRTNDIEFSLNGSGGFTVTGVTGDSGDKGKTIFERVAPGAYTLKEIVPSGTEQVFVLSCSDNTNEWIQGYPLALGSELNLSVEPGSKITCFWYNVPSLYDSGAIQITKYACATEYFVDESECEIYEGGARFSLSARQGNQWLEANDGVTNSSGLLTWNDLVPGIYQIDEVDSEWCYAEAEHTDGDGYLKVAAGETTNVSVWNCGIAHDVKKPVKYPNTGVNPSTAIDPVSNAPIDLVILNPRQWAGVFDERLVNFISSGEKPTGIRIASVGIVGQTEILETVDGAMQDPTTSDLVAWYRDSGKLGEDGNLVLAGHLNYWGDPEGVFFRLAEVQVGDDIVVTGDRGGVYHYRVTWIQQVDSNDSEISEIVGPTESRSITLITCGGSWDSEAREYNERTVVRAELVNDQA